MEWVRIFYIGFNLLSHKAVGGVGVCHITGVILYPHDACVCGVCIL